MAESKNQPRRWHRLDNTANLFPVVTSRRFTNVFRLALNLNEPVVPELLQRALEQTLPRFAAFRVRLRHGMFWHYLEANPATPTVQAEDDYPVRYIDPAQNDQFLFRVSYFANRVNLEIFHVLTDGTGSLRFLQAIVCRYLLLAHPAAFTDEEKARSWFAEHSVNTEDSYATNYAAGKKSNYSIGRGYRLRGEKNLLDNLSVIHVHVALPGLLAHCRGLGVTVTQYVSACIGWAVYTQQMHSKPAKLPLNIFLPVNLRGMFESNTALNFFSNVYITLPLDKAGLTFEDILAMVKQQFAEKINKEEILEKINYTVGGGSNALVRFAPLPVKNAVLRLIYESSAKSASLGYTNLGQAKMPAPFQKFVTGAYFLNSTAPREPFKVASISYGNVFTLSFSSVLRSVALQRAVVRKFTADGLSVTVESNGVDYESM